MQIAGASRMTIRTPMNPLEQGFLSKRLEWMLHRSIRLAGLQAVAGIETSGAAHMIWIAPSEKDHDNAALEKRLWAAADQFRANSASDIRSSEQELRRQLAP